MNIGYVAGESTPSFVEVITSSALAVGKYIMIGSGSSGILGLVENSKVSSSAMDIAKDYRSAQEATQVSSIDLRDKRYTSKYATLCLIYGSARFWWNIWQTRFFFLQSAQGTK